MIVEDEERLSNVKKGERRKLFILVKLWCTLFLEYYVI